MSGKATSAVVCLCVLTVGGLALSVGTSGSALGQAASSGGAAPAGSSADACCKECFYIWSAKYVCEKTVESAPAEFDPFKGADASATSSRSLTSRINVHNPLEQSVRFEWKVAPARSVLDNRLAQPSQKSAVTLGGNQAVQIDCGAIARQFGDFDPEGFVVIESEAPLAVTAVYYTREEVGNAAQVGGEPPTGVGLGVGVTVSLDVEQVIPTTLCRGG